MTAFAIEIGFLPPVVEGLLSDDPQVRARMLILVHLTFDRAIQDALKTHQQED